MSGLEGRLETLQSRILTRWGGLVAETPCGHMVVVNYNGLSMPEYFLAIIDHQDKNPRPGRARGNFVSHDLQGRPSLACGRYVLTGIWKPWMPRYAGMQSHERGILDYSCLPTINEIYMHYSPGHMPKALFLLDGISKKSPKYEISRSGRFRFQQTLLRKIRDEMAMSHLHVCAIISPCEESIIKASSIVREMGLVPVSMEPYQ